MSDGRPDAPVGSKAPAAIPIASTAATIVPYHVSPPAPSVTAATSARMPA